MTNTAYLYTTINDFRNAQNHNRSVFLEKKKNLEKYAGSDGYAEELRKIRQERESNDEEARAICREKMNNAINCMVEVNRKRRCTPPTEEQIRLIQSVKLMQKPDIKTLDAVANSMDGNAIGLKILDDIAREAWKDDPNPLNRYTPKYTSMATMEMSIDDAQEAIKSLAGACKEILNGSGADHIRTFCAESSNRLHGTTFDLDELPREREYSSEKDFYNRALPWRDYTLFANAVNDA